jgi:hypothetical protein
MVYFRNYHFTRLRRTFAITDTICPINLSWQRFTVLILLSHHWNVYRVYPVCKVLTSHVLASYPNDRILWNLVRQSGCSFTNTSVHSIMKNVMFWDLTPCNIWKFTHVSEWYIASFFRELNCLLVCLATKMETVYSFGNIFQCDCMWWYTPPEHSGCQHNFNISTITFWFKMGH